jgi:hypothetical protein
VPRRASNNLCAALSGEPFGSCCTCTAAKPWCQLHAELDAAARTAQWAGRDPRLYFSGGLDNGHHRKALRALALSEAAAGRTSELLVRDVGSKFHRWGQFDRKQPTALHDVLRGGANRTAAGGSALLDDPLMASVAKLAVAPTSAASACAHQLTINVPGFGYSSRLRALLACGGAVLHVEHSSSEFFMPLLQHQTHYYLLRGREVVRDGLLPLLRALRRDPKTTAAVAANARRFARSHLAFDAVPPHHGLERCRARGVLPEHNIT